MKNEKQDNRVRLGPVALELIEEAASSTNKGPLLDEKIQELIDGSAAPEQAQSSSELSPSNVAMLQDVLDKLTGLENRVKDLNETHLHTIKETTTGFGALAQEIMCTRNQVAALAPKDKGAQELIAAAREVVAGIYDKALPGSMLRAAHEMAQEEEQRRLEEIAKEHAVTPEPELPMEKAKVVSAEPEREM